MALVEDEGFRHFLNIATMGLFEPIGRRGIRDTVRTFCIILQPLIQRLTVQDDSDLREAPQVLERLLQILH